MLFGMEAWTVVPAHCCLVPRVSANPPLRSAMPWRPHAGESSFLSFYLKSGYTSRANAVPVLTSTRVSHVKRQSVNGAD
jgi:hypothetical protein